MPDLLLVAASDRELVPVAGARPIVCGIGPVEASLATARALANGGCSAVLQVGIAGATTLKPGSVVIGSSSVYCDVIDPNATHPRVTLIDAAPGLLATAIAALPEAAVLPIATAGRVGAGFGYEVEAMEGFGVLRAAELARVPALEVRVISNRVADVDRALWRVEDALPVLHDAIERLVPALSGSDPRHAREARMSRPIRDPRLARD